MKIISQNKSVLLKRTEIVANLDHVGKATPKRSEIKKQLAKEFKKDEKLVVIKHIYTNFGAGTSKIIANVYDNEEALKTLEIEKENKPKEAKQEPKKEEPKKEEKKEEKVKEDAKETKTKEQKAK